MRLPCLVSGLVGRHAAATCTRAAVSDTLRSRARGGCRRLRADPEHPFEQLTQQLGPLAEQIEQLVAIELQRDAAAHNIGGLAERLSRQHAQRADDVAGLRDEPDCRPPRSSSDTSPDRITHSAAGADAVKSDVPAVICTLRTTAASAPISSAAIRAKTGTR